VAQDEPNLGLTHYPWWLMTIIDISVALHNSMPSWPGSAGFKLTHVGDMAHGAMCNVSQLSCDVHIGTHVDAPWHFLPGGKTVELMSLSQLVGNAYVAHALQASSITAQVLESLKIPDGVSRLPIRTKNSELWAHNHEFQKDFVALTVDAAEWLVKRKVQLIGIDYLSIQRFIDPPTTHQILLRAEMAIIEGLNLSKVEEGHYELICLPLKLVGSDGAPARAILRKD
jgi:arylformamidase